jgi:hypothetical protein
MSIQDAQDLALKNDICVAIKCAICGGGIEMDKCEKCGEGCDGKEIEAMEKALVDAGFEAHDLDSMVHEAASCIASAINNSGMIGQIEFLIINGFNPLVLLERLGEEEVDPLEER